MSLLYLLTVLGIILSPEAQENENTFDVGWAFHRMPPPIEVDLSTADLITYPEGFPHFWKSQDPVNSKHMADLMLQQNKLPLQDPWLDSNTETSEPENTISRHFTPACLGAYSILLGFSMATIICLFFWT